MRRLTRTLTGYWRWRTGHHTHLYSLDRTTPVCCLVCGRPEKEPR